MNVGVLAVWLFWVVPHFGRGILGVWEGVSPPFATFYYLLISFATILIS